MDSAQEKKEAIDLFRGLVIGTCLCVPFWLGVAYAGFKIFS